MASFIESVLRSPDLLHIQFEFVNLTLGTAANGTPQLKRVAGQTACIVIRLPPQHIAEQVFNSTALRTFPYQALLASPSRLAFDIPETVELPPYTVAGILDKIRQLSLRPPDQTLGTEPATAIELPYRVLLAPAPNARLFHRSTPLPTNDPTTDIQWTGLWSTRLAAEGSHGRGGISFRAIPHSADDAALNATLDRSKRQEIVWLSQTLSSPFVVSSPQSMLSSLGASTQLKGDWPTTASNVLSLWEHNTTVGRDSFVRIVDQGFLFPFGHRASKQTIFYRGFAALGPSGSGQIAELRQKITVRVEELERSYASPVGYDKGGREMPLKRIRITSQPDDLLDNNSPVRVDVTAIDWSGRTVNLSLNTLFLSRTAAATTAALNDAGNRYRFLNIEALASQRLALAEDREVRGDTTLTVTGLTFGAKILAVDGPVQPPFLPLMKSAMVSIPAVDKMLGSVADAATGNTPPVRTMTLHENYLNGFSGSDREQMFAKLDPAMPGLSIPASRAGGLTAPKFTPANRLSRARGLTSDVASFAGDATVDPTRIIASAKLLGMIDLAAIIEQTEDSLPPGDPAALFGIVDNPGVFITRPVLNTMQIGPNAVDVRFIWKPKLKTTGLPEPLMTTSGGEMTLIVKGHVVTAPSAVPNFEVHGKLTNFGLAFGKLLTVNFRSVVFESGASKKMKFTTDIQNVTFGTELGFIEKLSQLLPTNSLGGGPQIEPRPDGLTVRFNAGIPSFAIGIMSIQNIGLLTSVSLPFVDGKPAAVRFALSDRNQPFLVSVSIFGGTGFFALEVRTDKSVLVEAGIEFGGVVSINLLGIIKGGVYLFAGIYVSVESGGVLAVSGHLRLGGYVDVAGIISISIEIYIALTYYSSDRLLLGEGRVTVSVKILFFSLSKSFVVTRRISGFGDAPSDSLIGLAAIDGPPLPNFTTAMNRLQWDKYCKAFA